MYWGKYRLLNGVMRWWQCSGVQRGCVNRIRLWPLRCDDHSGGLIGAGGTRRSDWPARVLANDVNTRIDRQHACRSKWQLAATGVGLNAIHDQPYGQPNAFRAGETPNGNRFND